PPANPDPVRRRRPADPAGQRPADALPDPTLAAARVPRRPPGPGHRGRRARAGDRPVPGRRAASRRRPRGPQWPAGLAARILPEEDPMTNAADADFYQLEQLLDDA